MSLAAAGAPQGFQGGPDFGWWRIGLDIDLCAAALAAVNFVRGDSLKPPTRQRGLPRPTRTIRTTLIESVCLARRSSTWINTRPPFALEPKANVRSSGRAFKVRTNQTFKHPMMLGRRATMDPAAS